jgi:alpha-mannosidase
LKEDYPSVYERVKAKVKSGQFHPIGGCWIEHDTNLPSGESLVRQFLYGQRFFEAEFGTRSTTCWLPDTFGFSSQLPQLCRQAGMNRFLTQKPCFNSVNDFPHTSFNWYVKVIRVRVLFFKAISQILLTFLSPKG